MTRFESAAHFRWIRLHGRSPDRRHQNRSGGPKKIVGFPGGRLFNGEMHDRPDLQLLRDFAQNGDEAAFREIVGRYADLVHSAALRQTESSAAAADIAQGVFTDLARKAGKVAQGDAAKLSNSLAGWLHRATRHAALNYLRDARRRSSNERQAMEQLLANSEPAADWEQIRPLLDEALDSLGNDDREALLLRYFKNEDFRAVGVAFGVSDDAAQKRVSRAVERLREFFAKRPLPVGAGGLAMLISTNAVQAAPAGLAAAASTAALAATAGGTGALTGLLKLITMTKLQTAIIGTVLAGIVATSIVLQSQSRLRQENQGLREQLARLKADNEGLAGQVAQLKSTPAQPVATAAVAAVSPAGRPLKSFQEVTDFLDAHDRRLSPEQIEAYLQRNHRNMESLLAAFQVSQNAAYLREAATNFPGNPAVQFAVIANHAFPDDQRKWIDAFKRSSPDNALPYYFSALDYFAGNQPDQAMAELTQGTRRQLYSDYAAQTGQAVEEMYVSAGWPDLAAQAAAPGMASMSPYLNMLKELGNQTVQGLQQDVAQGNTEAANSMASMGMILGDQLRQASGPIDELVGIGIENKILKQLDPSANYDFLGRSVADALADLAQQKNAIKGVMVTRDQVRPTLNEAELANYWEREKMYGEMYAMQWLQSLNPQP